MNKSRTQESIDRFARNYLNGSYNGSMDSAKVITIDGKRHYFPAPSEVERPRLVDGHYEVIHLKNGNRINLIPSHEVVDDNDRHLLDMTDEAHRWIEATGSHDKNELKAHLRQFYGHINYDFYLTNTRWDVILHHHQIHELNVGVENVNQRVAIVESLCFRVLVVAAAAVVQVRLVFKSNCIKVCYY